MGRRMPDIKITRKNLLKMIALAARQPPRHYVDGRTRRDGANLRMDLHSVSCNFIAPQGP